MLDELISRATLEELAGSTAFQRGEAYFSEGAVGCLSVAEDKATASVKGSETYQVELWVDDGDLARDCTCPRAADGYFCKHCVALGLAVIAENSAAAPGQQDLRDPWRDITDYLSTLTQDSLIEQLLDVARRDDRLYQSLLLRAEQTTGGGDVAKAFRRAIDHVAQVDGYVEWREARTFAGNIDEVVDSLAELLKPDTAAILVELAEYAVEQLEASLEYVDDSNGEIGGIICRLGELHVQACSMARPDPADLAERLFELETTLPFGVCSFDVKTYHDALGKEGLQRYRELAEAEWRKLKPRDAKDSYDYQRAKITGIMEQLAEVSGDVEELVAIKSQDLTLGYHYLEIAEIWTKAGQPDKALEWAERGLQAFPERPDNRLRDFLVAAYLERKRNDEALQLTWVQFEERPSLELYKKLQAVAVQLGLWAGQRNRALTRLAEVIAHAASTTSQWKPKPSLPDFSLRMEIALWEDDLDAAWSAAHEGFCHRNLLITLAGKLESLRPENAVSLYRRVVPPIVEQTGNAAYEEAIRLVRKVGGLMQAQNQSRQFGDYLGELRLQFKPKRNFIKLLDGVARSTTGGK
ncbi:SWIM zinc finger family protein [Propionivibrio sp.]|uniref:SWIM zinc finger family protein n=1 Tax=Propionivibrio sp. TaxID=2212460 RepID=UPI003BF3FFD5